LNALRVIIAKRLVTKAKECCVEAAQSGQASAESFGDQVANLYLRMADIYIEMADAFLVDAPKRDKTA